MLTLILALILAAIVIVILSVQVSGFSEESPLVIYLTEDGQAGRRDWVRDRDRDRGL